MAKKRVALTLPSDEPLQDDEYISRSQKKRESLALQALGKHLVTLPISVVEEYPVSAHFLEAVKEWHSFDTHESKRRQMQYIGRLIHEENWREIAAMLDAREQTSHETTELFHKAEQLRDVLLTCDEKELAEHVQHFAASKQILQLVEQARAEKAAQKKTGAGKKLFKAMREFYEAQINNSVET